MITKKGLIILGAGGSGSSGGFPDEAVNALVARLDSAEAEIERLRARVATGETSDTEMRGQVDALSTRVTTGETDNTEVRGLVDALSTRVDSFRSWTLFMEQ